ncbi:polymorphic toxin-type HINT domain-containing protein [Streptomyces melanogenes]|uniref:Polymorphic toxin-type HINT domain-containing protein n=1 Tax=Streptomyces melanogenes TaxID=67326 RepID=A0ABZ1XW90_9ACTN|nr:polymorphic toxin-type HINT domain-containing protein [Streptomyces melanogenes]
MQPKAVPLKKVAAGGAQRRDDAALHRWKGAPEVTWPSAGSADVNLAAPSTAKTPQRAGKLPVTVAPAQAKARTGTRPAAVKVAVADQAKAHKAGVQGLLLSVGRTDGASTAGPAEVSVDYESFNAAYGGDWASRLRLVQLPACALTTPDKGECRTQTPLATRNDTKKHTLTATAMVNPQSATPASSRSAVRSLAASGATVLAATAGASGASGDYKATSLQPSGSWTAGGSSGGFTWNYPIGAPAVPGGLQPKLSLYYSSQSVDGRTSASNSQAGWVGDGWSMEPGFIERRYKPCNDDQEGATNSSKVGDLCWPSNDNATLSLGGKSTELVYQAGKGWHPASDSGEKVEKLSDSDYKTANGDNNGEHWKVTATDGTQYFFGLNRLPGWRDDNPATTDKDPDPVTNSTLTVPVFGNQSSEPCYDSSFDAASCDQGWRWNLDYVVDPHGNAMAYYWNKETNNYARNMSLTTGTGTPAKYNPAGYLDHIDYGLRSGAAYTGKAMGKVAFGVSDRCLQNCAFDADHAANWPDVPFDQFCKDGDDCKGKASPTFWSRKRLTMVTTKVLTGGEYKNVDSWTLDQDFPNGAGDGISHPMWLKSITRTGLVGGTTQLPPVTFKAQGLSNRVDKTGDGLAPYFRMRLSEIRTETGGTIGVSYAEDPDCGPDKLPPTDGTNTTRCYSVKWPFEGEKAKRDWFVTYPVTQVREGDNLAETPDVETNYRYLGGVAWTKSTDEFAKAEDRTYSINRGYGQVQTRTGTSNEAQTLTETRYFRGVDGADVLDSAGAKVTDREQFAGMIRENATFNGDNTDKLVSATSYTPWRSAVTATRTRTGLPDLEAHHTGTESERTRTPVSGDRERTTKITRTFDEYGMVTKVSDLGDEDVNRDETCTTTSYTRNTGKWMLDKVAGVVVTSVPCTLGSQFPDNLISDTRTFYDGATSVTAAPTKGDVTKVQKLKGNATDTEDSDWDTVSSTPSTCGSDSKQLCYDQYGRPLAGADAYGKTTTTAYVPADGEPATKTTVTNARGQAVVTTVDPLRGLPTTVTDINNAVTTTSYDPLGRTTGVWLPTHTQAAFPQYPNYKYEYLVRNDGPVVVTTGKLNSHSTYTTTYGFFDGLLRPRQTQAIAPDDSGRLVTETFYNSRGEAWWSSGTYWAEGKAEPVLVTGKTTSYPNSTETEFDGAGRPTAVISKHLGDETKRTTTSYTGDSTIVTPPQGGTTTKTVVDAHGRKTAVYNNGDPKAAVSYTYNSLGQLAEVQDAVGAKWTYGYDVRGRQVRVDDPDKGTSTTTYDQGDRVTDVKDARGITLHTDYDDLGRRTKLTQGTTVLSEWTYDGASNGKGRPYTATRYVDGKPYTNTNLSYTLNGDPVGIQATIPDSQGALAGTYKWTTAYDAVTRLPQWTQQPAIGGLPLEKLYYGITGSTDLPGTLYAGSDPIVSETLYDHYGRTQREEYGALGKKVYASYTYDDHTSALTSVTTDRDLGPARIDDTHYTYDPAGNITSITTGFGQDTARTVDTQCFVTDNLRRITQAWTATDQCKTTPTDASSATVGGPDAYWTSYTYDAIGNRTTETQHKTASGPAADAVRTYTAPAAGKHALPQVTETGPTAHTETYGYDQAGNTTSRKTGTTADQTLTWDTEGHLATVTQSGATTSYLYDTGGNRLTRTDSTGTTLYLPSGNELVLKSGTVTGTRYYSYNGKTAAVRTAGKLTFLLSDAHGTTTSQVDVTTQAITRRRTTIFGAPRGTAPTTWTGDKGFVGGTKDLDTGLTHLGAREYDPKTGRFISVDPLLETDKPQSLSGYTYAENNPVAGSDPTGMSSFSCNMETGSCPTGSEEVETQQKTVLRGTTPASSPRPKLHPAWHVTVPPKYRYEVNGVCTYAMTGSCETVSPPAPSAEDILDLPCPAGDPGWLCSFRNSYYKTAMIFGPMAGMVTAARGWGGRGKGRTETNESGVKPTQCFLAGTQVLMGDKSTKKIEEVKVGDEVLATDPEQGRTSKRKVTALIITEGEKQFTELTIATAGGSKKLTATREHPFWVESEHRWVVAGELAPSMTLLTDDGTAASVQSSRSYSKHARTYNLTVADVHTYYVLAGSTPVLVHNTCGPDLGDSWKPKPASQVCGTGGCEKVADHIQSVIGGDIMRITDRYGAPHLGKYRGIVSGWNYHDVVVKEGRVFDATTGRRGEPIDQYRENFEYGDDLIFSPAPR